MPDWQAISDRLFGHADRPGLLRQRVPIDLKSRPSGRFIFGHDRKPTGRERLDKSKGRRIPAQRDCQQEAQKIPAARPGQRDDMK